MCAGMRVTRFPRPRRPLATVSVWRRELVQPHAVGQVGRAQRRVALAVGAMAGGAGRELRLAELRLSESCVPERLST